MPTLKLVSASSALWKASDRVGCRIELDNLRFVLWMLPRNMFLHASTTVIVNTADRTRKPYTLRSFLCGTLYRYYRLEGGNGALKLLNGYVTCGYVLRL